MYPTIKSASSPEHICWGFKIGFQKFNPLSGTIPITNIN